MTTTDIPRMDAASFSSRDRFELMQTIRKLERELNKAKAEVERIREQLQQAVDIAEEFWNNQKQAITVYHQELADELDQIKATLNQTDK